MRLIDIDELKGCAIIRPHSRADMKAIESCSEVVLYDDIPTAYDIDKVVEEIKHQIQLEFDWLRAVKHEEGHINLSDLDIAERAMKSKAIEIGKGGVK